MIQFFIPLRKIPSVTQQTHKITAKGAKPRIYETAELKAARQLFRDHLAKHRPEAPLEGPVELSVIWCYPASKAHPDGTWKTTKPDTDNLVKMLKDELTRLGFWHDDAQVCHESLNKLYNQISGVSIQIRRLRENIADYDLEVEEGGGEDG
jgi:Holliday junction resolvase RusA-like endonuclease